MDSMMFEHVEVVSWSTELPPRREARMETQPEGMGPGAHSEDRCSMGSELRTSFDETALGQGNSKLVSRAETATAALIPWKQICGESGRDFRPRIQLCPLQSSIST